MLEGQVTQEKNWFVQGVVQSHYKAEIITSCSSATLKGKVKVTEYNIFRFGVVTV